MKHNSRWGIFPVGDHWEILNTKTAAEPKWAKEYSNHFTSEYSAYQFGVDRLGLSLQIYQ